MSAREVGVFLNAHHLLTVAPEQRAVGVLLDQVRTGTTQLLLTGAVSYRVIAGDCSVPAVRELADRYALDGGFLIRHCPSAGPPVSTVLAAEVAAAALASADLRVAAIGDDIAPYAPIAETLRRSGRWVVNLTTADTASGDGAADLLLELRVDRNLRKQELKELYLRLIEEAGAEGAELTTARLNQGFQRAIPGFRPRLLGYRTFDELLADVRPRTPAARPAQPSAAPNLRQRASAACQTLSVEGQPETRDQHAAVAVRVLDAWLTDDLLAQEAGAQGLPLPWMGDALQTAVPQWALPPDLKMTALCRAAVRRTTGWTLVRGGEGPHTRLFRGTEPPPGFEPI